MPGPDEVKSNTKGAAMNISKKKEVSHIRGELIAVDSTKLYVLSVVSHKVIEVPMEKVSFYRVRFMRMEDIAWTFPILILSTFSHGFFAILTLPFNILTVNALNNPLRFMSTSRMMTYEELSQYARFPQGLPPNVALSDIK